MHVKEILTRVIMGFYMGLFILDSLLDKYKKFKHTTGSYFTRLKYT